MELGKGTLYRMRTIAFGFLATSAAALVVTAFLSPLLWLWPYIGQWYGFPILIAWFVAAIHSASKAAMWVADQE